MEVSPLAIFFVKNGSNGDKMLFKYPFDNNQGTTLKSSKRNPFSLGNRPNSITQKPPPMPGSESSAEKLSQFLDEELSYLLAVNKRLCGNKFELKVNDVRFISHPVNLENENKEGNIISGSTILIFNIVFALKVSIRHDIVNSYYDLSKMLGIALRFEEQRCHFLSDEAKIMLAELDEQSQQPEANRRKSVFQTILSKSLIAKHLKKVYDDLCSVGKVNFRLNNWIDISFSLPQKLNYGFGSSKRITHEVLIKGFERVKPYHTILLLRDRKELLKTMSTDVSPALRRLLDVHSPINTFYTLAADADLTLPHVLDLACQLVFWGEATIIYPVCITNVYVLSPFVPSARMNKLAESFQSKFPDSSYHQTLYEYSLPISLRDKCTPVSLPHEQQQENEKLLWLLRHGLLQQLHTYIYIMPKTNPKDKTVSKSSRGLLATVAEAVTEKHGEDTNSSSSSFKDEFDWQEVLNANKNGLQGSFRSSSFQRETREQSVDEDQNSQDSGSAGLFQNRKNSSSEDVLSASSSFVNQRSSQNIILNHSFTPSENGFGSAHSVGSDERSLSPGCGSSLVSKKTIIEDLDVRLTQYEQEMLLKTEEAKNLEDLREFAKLCHYFRGENHMEEIMYYANIHRSQLSEIIEKFRDVLVTVQRVDPSISFAQDIAQT